MRGRIPGSAGWRTNSLEAARAIRVPANFRGPVEERGHMSRIRLRSCPCDSIEGSPQDPTER